MNITLDNYHSEDAEREYLSYHQFRNWVACPACEWARQHGLYTQPMSEDLMIGKRVDIALLTPEKLAAFDNSPDAREWFFTKKGLPNAAYAVSERCIARAQREKDAWLVLDGEHQAILTFEIDGVPWRCAIDSLDTHDGIIADLKTCRDFGSEWIVSNGKNIKVPWYEARGYWGQLAVYRHAVKQQKDKECECYILGVTKQDPADIEIIPFLSVARFDRELEYIEYMQPFVLEWKGRETIDSLPRCGHCKWCITTKRIDLNALPPAESLLWPDIVNKWNGYNNKQQEDR